MRAVTFSFALTLAALAASMASAGAPDQSDEITAGHYQAILGDCGACHTKPGGKPFAGGLPLETPFGALVPPNITPDRESGIGSWTREDFGNALKIGVGHGGKRLYPAMPYPAYTKMSDQDVTHLWSYIQTLEPVHNPVEAILLPFPFNVRLALLGWNMLNFAAGDFKPDPSKTAEWNRGAYIVEGPGHCGTCHTPKSALGADERSEALQGASLQGWYAPNITGNTFVGVGLWSDAELVQYLRSGQNAHTIASGPMAEAISASTSKMKEEDLKAIAVYLKTARGGPATKPAPLEASDIHMKTGLSIYQANCSACHGGDGKGAAQLFPALAGNTLIQQQSAETLARLVLNGSQAVGTKDARTTPAMPSFAWRLNDQQVADVLTYIRNSWGNGASPIEPDVVSAQR
jgi:mono/diheme cytochrome c family protein